MLACGDEKGMVGRPIWIVNDPVGWISRSGCTGSAESEICLSMSEMSAWRGAMFHGDGGRKVDVDERDGVTHVPCCGRGGRWRSRGVGKRRFGRTKEAGGRGRWVTEGL